MTGSTGKMRKRIGLNLGWLFTTEEQQNYQYDAYQLTKTGASVTPAAMSFDDHTWQIVDLPHDFVVKQELDAAADPYNGYLKRKNGWYRRYFYLSDQWERKRVILHFGGISGKSEIYLNGCLLKKSDSSFCDVEADISDYINTGRDVNVLAVHLDHSFPEGWWYQGGGLYRSVWLEAADCRYLNEEQLFIRTCKKTEETWQVTVETAALCRYGDEESIRIRGEIREIGNTAESASLCSAAARGITGERIVLCFEIRAPKLWDVGKGNLYMLSLDLITGEGITDSIYQTFGFREIRFDAEKGFIINGRPTKIKGLCFHEDEGNLGWAIDKTVYERRILQLIEMGGNAYRCSHNAPDSELLQLCDRYGILVMDETRRFDSGEIGMAELKHLICRDRNHPSVILWSLGNEETWQGTSKGKKIAESMKRMADKLDGTRAVTLAMHQDFDEEGAAGYLDVIGVNYNHESLPELRRKYPHKAFIGSEVLNLADDITESGNTFPGSVGAHETLLFADTAPFYAGTFGWAGADYRGEHRNLAFFTDACPLNCNGARKDGFYQYQARWTDKPVVHICGHWNPDAYAKNLPGELRKVRVISNLSYIRLYINKKPVAVTKIGSDQQAEFLVPYESGTLRAEGYSCDPDQKEDRELSPVSVDEIVTSGAAHHFTVYPEKQSCPADGESRITLWIEVKDENEIPVPTAAHLFRVDCDGGAEVICTDNADPYCSSFPDQQEMGLYKGKGKAIIRSGRTAGKVKISVSGSGLVSAFCEIDLTETKKRKEELMPAASPFINDWFVSRIYENKPDIYEYTTDDNYSFWRKSLERAAMIEQSLPFFYTRGGNGYVIYCMEPNMPDIREGETGKVVFEEITGSCEILISKRDYDNRILKRFYLESTQERPRYLEIELPGVDSGDRLIIKVLIKGSHSKCGITGPVRFA